MVDMLSSPVYCCHIFGEQKEAARQELEIKVRGKGCPPLVNTWEQCGFSERVLSVIRRNQFKVSDVLLGMWAFRGTRSYQVLYEKLAFLTSLDSTTRHPASLYCTVGPFLSVIGTVKDETTRKLIFAIDFSMFSLSISRHRLPSSGKLCRLSCPVAM